MSPWLVLVAFVAAINLAAFTVLRGRWDRQFPVLAAASLLGTAVGSGIGERTGLELLRIGEVGLASASVVAQLSMLIVSLLAHLVPARAAPSRQPKGTGRDGPAADQ